MTGGHGHHNADHCRSAKKAVRRTRLAPDVSCQHVARKRAVAKPTASLCERRPERQIGDAE
jgi:hypothetical protein